MVDITIVNGVYELTELTRQNVLHHIWETNEKQNLRFWSINKNEDMIDQKTSWPPWVESLGLGTNGGQNAGWWGDISRLLSPGWSSDMSSKIWENQAENKMLDSFYPLVN